MLKKGLKAGAEPARYTPIYPHFLVSLGRHILDGKGSLTPSAGGTDGVRVWHRRASTRL